MSEVKEKNLSILQAFSQSQETFEEAQEKSKKESNKRINYLRLNKDGKYSVRILPIAPVFDADGNPVTDRKGYEYPLRSLILKINGPQANDGKSDKKNKDKNKKDKFVTVCNLKQVFPTLDNDLIDLYVKMVCQNYSDDTKLCENIKKSSFEKGLRWNSDRCMYVIDLEDTGKGIQILQLSYPQYKELEDRKLDLWQKLIKKNPKAPCPISSFTDAYPVEITRKTENKTTYSFNINTLDKSELSEETLNELFDTARLPETLYHYTRYHLEATIEFLKQYDEIHDINVMDCEEIKNCIEQIKLLLSPDDQSHFSFQSGNDRESDEDSLNDIDSLWDKYDALDKEGLDDKSEEGQELRSAIRQYIDDNGLDVSVNHKKTNYDLLSAIDSILNNDGNEEEEEEEEPKKPSRRKAASKKEEIEEEEAEEQWEDEAKEEAETDDDEEESDDSESEEEAEEAEEEAPRRSRRREERNDDTNEPAVRSERRRNRPARRR